MNHTGDLKRRFEYICDMMEAVGCEQTILSRWFEWFPNPLQLDDCTARSVWRLRLIECRLWSGGFRSDAIRRTAAADSLWTSSALKPKSSKLKDSAVLIIMWGLCVCVWLGGGVNNHHCGFVIRQKREKYSWVRIFFDSQILSYSVVVLQLFIVLIMLSGVVCFIPICLFPVPALDLFACHQISNCFLLNKSCRQWCQATTASSLTLIYIAGCHFVAKLGFVV